MTSPPLASYSNASVPAKYSTSTTVSELFLQRPVVPLLKKEWWYRSRMLNSASFLHNWVTGKNDIRSYSLQCSYAITGNHWKLVLGIDSLKLHPFYWKKPCLTPCLAFPVPASQEGGPAPLASQRPTAGTQKRPGRRTMHTVYNTFGQRTAPLNLAKGYPGCASKESWSQPWASAP